MNRQSQQSRPQQKSVTSSPLTNEEIDAIRRQLYPRKSACRSRCRPVRVIS